MVKFKFHPLKENKKNVNTSSIGGFGSLRPVLKEMAKINIFQFSMEYEMRKSQPQSSWPKPT
jgi:hypothetical protein